MLPVIIRNASISLLRAAYDNYFVKRNRSFNGSGDDDGGGWKGEVGGGEQQEGERRGSGRISADMKAKYYL